MPPLFVWRSWDYGCVGVRIMFCPGFRLSSPNSRGPSRLETPKNRNPTTITAYYGNRRHLTNGGSEPDDETSRSSQEHETHADIDFEPAGNRRSRQLG